MRKVVFIALLGALSAGCSDSSSSPSPVSVDASNAKSLSRLGYQQFIALHSNELLMRNTILNAPDYTSPCSSGTYSAVFADAANNSRLDTGDTITESYSSCALGVSGTSNSTNAGDIVVSGTVTSRVTATTTNTVSIDITHSNVNVTVPSLSQTFSYNGNKRSTINANVNLSTFTTFYNVYTVNFNGQSTTVNAGTATVDLNSTLATYRIKHSLVFTGPSFSGVLRTENLNDVSGTTNNLQPSFPIVGTGSLRIESVSNSQYVEMDANDGDTVTSGTTTTANNATYQQTVRANGVTTTTPGQLWSDISF